MTGVQTCALPISGLQSIPQPPEDGTGQSGTLEQMEGRVKRDVWYIENWTFFLDLKIIVVTVLNMFKGEKNAY